MAIPALNAPTPDQIRSSGGTPQNPHVYLHTHVQSDGSVTLDCIVGTANKFAQVMEDCRALRTNREAVFPQFVARAQSYVSLQTTVAYLLKGAKLGVHFDPLKSPEVTALLTDEYQRQLQKMDNPRQALRIVKCIEIRGKVTRLVRSDDLINYRFPRGMQDPYLLTLHDLREAFSNSRTPTEIQKKISELVQQLISYKTSRELGYEATFGMYLVLSPAIYPVKTVFQGMLCKSNNDEICEISNIGFVEKTVKEGKEFFTLSIQYFKQDSPTQEQLRKGVIDVSVIPKMLLAAYQNVNAHVKEYTNFSFDTLKNRSYNRGPKAEFTAKNGKLYDALEMSTLHLLYCLTLANKKYGDLPRAIINEIAEELMMPLNRALELQCEKKDKSTDQKDAH